MPYKLPRILCCFTLLIASSWATAQSPLSGSVDPADESTDLPRLHELEDGWWNWFLTEEERTDKGRIDEYEAYLNELKPSLDASLHPLADSVIDGLQRLETVPAVPQIPDPDDVHVNRLSQLMEAIRELQGLEKKVADAKSESELDKALINDLDTRRNRIRDDYADAEAISVRQTLGLRWMQSWCRLRLIQRQVAFNESRVNGLVELRSRYQTLADTPARELLFDNEERAYWRDQLTAVNSSLDGPRSSSEVLSTERLNSGDLATAAALRDLLEESREQAALAGHVLAERALWMTNARIDDEFEAPANSDELSADLLTDLRRWLQQTESFVEDQQRRVGERVASSSGGSDENVQLGERVEQLRRLSTQVNGVRVREQQLAAINRLNATENEGLTSNISDAWNGIWLWVGNQSDILDRTLFTLNDTAVTIGSMLRFIAIILAFWFGSRFLVKTMRRIQRRRNISAAAAYTFNRILQYVLILFGFLFAVSSIGIDLTKFALFASALGVGLGFGLQAMIGNFVSGLILLFERSLKIGDFVELESGVTGKVREINVRGTIITTNDNIDILVPNSEFVNGRVTNWTMRDSDRRMRIPFGVAYGVDKDKVKKAALEAANSVPFTLGEEEGHRSQVWLMEFGDNSLNFELVVWITGDAVSRPAAVHAAYSWAIESALRKYEIEIPFPQQDLNVRSFFGLEKQEAIRAILGDDSLEKEPPETEEAPDTGDDAAEATTEENDAAADAMRGIEERKREKEEQEKRARELEEENNEEKGANDAEENAEEGRENDAESDKRESHADSKSDSNDAADDAMQGIEQRKQEKESKKVKFDDD